MRRWVPALVAALVVLDLAVVAFGVRARSGDLPPFQRHSAEFTPAPTGASPSATAEPETGINAPLLLDANDSGLVLRATRGACEERFDNPARVWVGKLDDGADLAEVEVPALREVLGLLVTDAGDLRLSGLDDACEPATVVSKDRGASWEPADVGGIWRLDADVQKLSVTGPADKPAPVDCPPQQIVNLTDRSAIASCTSTTFFLLRPGLPAASLSADELSSLSVTAGPRKGEYYAFGTSPNCGALVALVVPEDQSTKLGGCIGPGLAPLAITTVGDRVLVQVGESLMVSDDQGDTFSAVPAGTTAG
jgi:hypothetical protein